MKSALLAISIAAIAAAQAPTIDQSLNLRTAGGARISPDGRYVAYVVRQTNWEENAFESEIWIAVTASGERYQLTRGKKSSSGPEWSPDGKRLAFISDREGKSQIYLIPPAGGEAVQLTKFETGVNSYRWSPDGRRIAFTASEPESKARKERKEKYGDFEIVDGDHAMVHLWVADVTEDGATNFPEPQRLIERQSMSVSSFAWSPDAQRIAFSAAKDPTPASGSTADLYVLHVADKSIRKLVDLAGSDRNPVWSPDGRQIAFEAANGREPSYLNSRIAVVPAEGGTPRVLTETFDEQPGLLEWAPDGIYFWAMQRTSAHLFHLHPSTRAIERLSAPDRATFNGFSFTRDFRRAAFQAAGPGEYPEVSVSTLRPFARQRLTAMSDQLKEFKLAAREVIEWKSSDGTPIEGILTKPADYDPSKRYPLLVVIHGGPTGVDLPILGPDRTYPLERFAARGALIMRPNYRGSTGYGEKFRSLNVRNLGVGDAWDVISGVDHLVANGMVDRQRVGAMGWSQGGYISAFLDTSSDRFKAVSVGAGISDWMTYYSNTDIPRFTRHYLQATPWDDPEIYRKTSPIGYIQQAKTPALIQHGENDRRVPIPNAYQLRRALEDRGVPVRMVVYKGFGHGVDKPKQQRHVMEDNWEWFSRWIWREQAGAAATATQSAQP